uniref:Cytochrome b n=1 Tax=Breviscolex orientalis TaxID=137570 RepID=A0A343ESQ4_9CEST|nr:cytochrome b [Breviscolex orientalis]ASL24590.1 cytochrome b [Breviscolex orientalis]
MLAGLRRGFVDLPINFSLGYYWCSGFVLSSLILVQTITGIVLSFIYVATPAMSFNFVLGETIDSLFYWVVRYWHIWGVTLIFILMFVHMGRALYYSSYSKLGVWNVGFIAYLLLMVEAFLGYILPWHQMSYWAATVLTTIVQGLPIIGASLYSYVVGGFAVSNITLIRVFSVHVCLGFVIIGVLLLHVVYLHAVGTNNPLSSEWGYSDVVYFHSYLSTKDLLSLSGACFLTMVGIWLVPDLVVDPDGYIEADVLLTPASIKPEWYFLGYYAVIRAIESKVGGLVVVTSILFFFWVPTGNYSCVYSSTRQVTFWAVVVAFVTLICLGACHPEYPYLFICKALSLLMLGLVFVFKVFWVSGRA